jgi:Domain of unknown function (DUF4214)
MQSTPSTLDELLACHDRHFVHSAYLMLLNRTPDPDGLSFYLGQLRTGSSKIRILAQLRLSKEGIAQPVKLPELDVALKLYKKEQRPLIGWFFRLLHSGEGNHSTERKLRVIENQLGLLNEENSYRFTQIENKLEALRDLLTLNAQTTDSQQGNTLGTISDLPVMKHRKSTFKVRLGQLSPRTRSIYYQLNSAANFAEEDAQCVS